MAQNKRAKIGINEVKEFVGRESYLEKIDEFINFSNPSGHVLLLVGDEGMGKSALLQAIAKRAAVPDHIVVLGDLNKYQSDFPEQIYPLIAQIKARPKLKIVEGSDWLKASLTGFALSVGIVFAGTTAVLAGGATALGNILIDIRKRHQDAGSSPTILSNLLYDELAIQDSKIGGAKRIVIILDPEKESPSDIIPLLRHISERGMPTKVRIIIAQRKSDELIQAYDRGECDNFCHEPLMLEFLEEKEQINFITSRDNLGRLSNEVRTEINSKYRGWPLLLELAIVELLKQDDPITVDDVRELPTKIEKFWERRYRYIKHENSLKIVQTICLLPHPYPVEKIAKFAGLSQSAITVVLNDISIFGLLDRVSYEDTLTQQLSGNCLAPKHSTSREYIQEEVETNNELKHELLDAIISHYQEIIGKDFECSLIDRDALVYYPQIIFINDNIDLFLSEICRLVKIKERYGLFDSIIHDHKIAQNICEKFGLKKETAVIFQNMGNIYHIRGELNKALEMQEKALNIYHELDDNNGVASIYCNLGNLYGSKSEVSKSLEMYNKSLDISREIENKEGMASNYCNMATVYQTIGEFDKALELLKKAEELYIVLDQKDSLAIVYNNMGIAYEFKNEFKKALEMQEKALEINMALGWKEGIASNYGNMGNIFQKSDQFDKALEMYEKSLSIEIELDHKEGIASGYNNIAVVYQLMGEFDKGLDMTQKALDIEIELGRQEGIATNYCNIGLYYINKGDFEKADVELRRSLEIYESIDSTHNISNVNELLTKLTFLKSIYRTPREPMN